VTVTASGFAPAAAGSAAERWPHAAASSASAASVAMRLMPRLAAGGRRAAPMPWR
jgi:hypothetical protein